MRSRRGGSQSGIRRGSGVRWLLALTFVFSSVAALVPVASAGAEDIAFDGVWATTDAAVASGHANYSWFWGPTSLLQTNEVYVSDHGDQREVRYYDKSRMEINNPDGDHNSIYYVTNGLLASELITGKLQYSDGGFEQRAPATVPVAGDPTNNPGTPTYRTFGDAHLATTDGVSYRAANRDGEKITDLLHGDGSLSTVAPDSVAFSNYQDATGHNFASVFWEWAHSGNSGFRPDIGVDWLYVLGYPITDPYWIDSTVGGTTHRVLVQLFERRALTYTPDNPQQYQVEFGNIGQHYYRWRYGSNGAVPGAYDIVFTTTIGSNTDLARINYDGSGYQNLTDTHSAYDGRPLYAPSGDYIAYIRGGNGDLGALAVTDRNGSDVRELDADVGAIHDWSYDSNYIAYESGGQLWVINRNGTQDRIHIGAGNLRASFAPSADELLATDGHSITRYFPLSGADPVPIATTPAGTIIQDIVWLKGNRYVAILDTASVSCVAVFSIGSSAIEITATCTNTTPLRGLHVSADQTECVYIATGASSDTLRIQQLTGSGRAHDLDVQVEGSGNLRFTGLDWSYHPTDIIFGATRGGASALYVIAHDSRYQHQLTDPSSLAARDPSLSPAR
jgi:hypothetical protein